MYASDKGGSKLTAEKLFMLKVSRTVPWFQRFKINLWNQGSRTGRLGGLQLSKR
jgi:hypothetical protein